MRWPQRWQPQSLSRGWGRDPKAPLARGSCAPRAKNKLEVLRLLGPGGLLRARPRRGLAGALRDLCSLSSGSPARVFRSGLRFRAEGGRFAAPLPKVLIQDPAGQLGLRCPFPFPWLSPAVVFALPRAWLFSSYSCESPSSEAPMLHFSPRPSQRLSGAALRLFISSFPPSCKPLESNPGLVKRSAAAGRARAGLCGCFLPGGGNAAHGRVPSIRLSPPRAAKGREDTREDGSGLRAASASAAFGSPSREVCCESRARGDVGGGRMRV